MSILKEPWLPEYWLGLLIVLFQLGCLLTIIVGIVVHIPRHWGRPRISSLIPEEAPEVIVQLYRGPILMFEKHYPDPVPDPSIPVRQCVDYLIAEKVVTPEEGAKLLENALNPEERSGP